MNIENSINLKFGGIKKTIMQINEEEAKKYKSIGKGSADNIGMVFHMAFNRCKNFIERVGYYRLTEKDDLSEMLSDAMDKKYKTIEFYEEKQIDLSSKVC